MMVSISWPKACYQKTTRICFLICCLFLLPAISSSVDTNKLKPHFEYFTNGKIDWKNGFIYGYGKSYLHHNGGSRARTLGAARILADGNILKVAAGVRLNDKRKLESLGEGRVVIQLKAFMRVEEVEYSFVENTSEPFFKVTRKSPISGIEGLTAKLLRHLKDKPLDWEDFPKPSTHPKTSAGEEETWLVLDARKLPPGKKVNPALFPKIVTPEGDSVYDLNKVNESDVLQRGMARYVETENPGESLTSDAGTMEQILAGAHLLFGAKEAFADDKTKRKKRKRYIVKQVNSTSGLMQTNLVVGAGDARKLVEADESSEILKKCRVIVVVSSPIGGVEGTLQRLTASLSLH